MRLEPLGSDGRLEFKSYNASMKIGTGGRCIDLGSIAHVFPCTRTTKHHSKLQINLSPVGEVHIQRTGTCQVYAMPSAECSQVVKFFIDTMLHMLGMDMRVTSYRVTNILASVKFHNSAVRLHVLYNIIRRGKVLKGWKARFDHTATRVVVITRPIRGTKRCQTIMSFGSATFNMFGCNTDDEVRQIANELCMAVHSSGDVLVREHHTLPKGFSMDAVERASAWVTRERTRKPARRVRKTS